MRDDMSRIKYTGCYIPGIDGKDLFLSSACKDEGRIGYQIRDKDSRINTKKFINTLDYSLDLIKLREIYKKVYRRSDFSFKEDGKEYTSHIINVSFNYSNKEYNRFHKGIYIKYGYSFSGISLVDSADIRNGELIAIQTEKPIKEALGSDILGSYFYFEGGVYKARNNIKTLHKTTEIRTVLYDKGFVCDGIEYVRWKRSAGSGRLGKCLFINKKLYKQMHRWEMCGIRVRKGKKIELSALEAYISLSLSSIIDTINISPHNILVIPDYKSVFKDTAMLTESVCGRLTTSRGETEITNSIWDGQSLLDKSLFGKYEHRGMLLLRSRFFKSCCFNTNIQKWFEHYKITDLSQLNGFTLAENTKDIKLITTPSSIKYLKFATLDEWLKSLDSVFGIVKHEKPTAYFKGRMVQCHYQLLNTIQLTYDEVGELLKPSLDYLIKLKTNPLVLRNHIKYREQYFIHPDSENSIHSASLLESKNDIVFKLLGLNKKFVFTNLYYRFVSDLTKAYTANLRKGRVLVRGNYSTLFGNPIEMLKHSIGKFNGVAELERGTIHSLNFKDGEDLLGSRSPHVTIGNILLTKNKIYPNIKEYFNLTNEIVCVNSIEENLLERLSGADFDSDSMLLTDNRVLISGTKRNYDRFPVPTKIFENVVLKREFSPSGKAELDIKTSINKIGEIINLSQELNSKLWELLNKDDFHDDDNGAVAERVRRLYTDASQLDIMSNLEIDSAKRESPADNSAELKLIKDENKELGQKGLPVRPMFFKYIDKDKGYYDPKRKTYRYYETAMDYVQKHINNFKLPKTNTKGFCRFIDIIKSEGLGGRINYMQTDAIIKSVRSLRAEIIAIYEDNKTDKQTKFLNSSAARQHCVELIKKAKMSEKTMYYLLSLIENEDYKDISRLLFNMLFGAPNESFYRLIEKSRESVGFLKETPDGEIKLYDFSYSVSY